MVAHPLVYQDCGTGAGLEAPSRTDPTTLHGLEHPLRTVDGDDLAIDLSGEDVVQLLRGAGELHGGRQGPDVQSYTHRKPRKVDGIRDGLIDGLGGLGDGCQTKASQHIGVESQEASHVGDHVAPRFGSFHHSIIPKLVSCVQRKQRGCN